MKFKNLNLKRTFAIISTAILVFFAASCKKCKSCKPEEERGVRYDNETSTLTWSGFTEPEISDNAENFDILKGCKHLLIKLH